MPPKVPTPNAALPLAIGGATLRTNPAGLVSLTDLFKAAESLPERAGQRSPTDWAREAGASFIDFVADSLNTRKAGIYATKRGKNGGTFAHWQIALAYAKYLSPALHMQVNEVYARFKAGDVLLAADIAERASPEKLEWLARRTAGIAARKTLTSTLAKHGVAGKGYADCTNAIYVNVLGGKKSQVVQQRGLKAGANLRDHMDAEQLVATAMSEIVARKRIVRGDVQGNTHCAAECLGASRSVMQLMR